MHVDEIRIENFKGIDSLSFNPKRFNIIVGRNNTGKTSILEAIKIAFDPKYIDENYDDDPSSLINYLSDSSVISLSVSNGRKRNIRETFERLKPEETISELLAAIKDSLEVIRSEYRHPITNVKFRKSLKLALDRFTAKIEDEKILGLIQETIKEQLNPENTLKISNDCIFLKSGNNRSVYYGKSFRKMQMVLTYKILRSFLDISKEDLPITPDMRIIRSIISDTNFLREMESSVPVRSDEEPVTLVKDPTLNLRWITSKGEGSQKLALEIEEIIKREALIPGLARFDFSEVVFETLSGRKAIPFERMGDGFQALVAILSLLKALKGSRIILLEEPELHMHPGYVSELVKYLSQMSSSLNIQLFITTHSYDLIGSLFEQKESDQQMEFLRNNLLLLRLTKNENTVIGESIYFDEAGSSLSDLQLDLRGI